MRDFFIHFSLGFIISVLGWSLSGEAIWIMSAPSYWLICLIFWKIFEKREHRRLAKILFNDIKNLGISLIGEKVSKTITLLEEKSKILLNKEATNINIYQTIAFNNKKILKLNNIWTYDGKIYAYSFEMKDSIFDLTKIEKNLFKLKFKKETERFFSNGKIDILITTTNLIRVSDIKISEMLRKEVNKLTKEIKERVYD